MKIKHVKVPSRHLGHSFTTSKGKTYVTFEGGPLYLVHFSTGEIVDISEVPEASGIRSQMPSYQGVSQWAYGLLLRTRHPRVIEFAKSSVVAEVVEIQPKRSTSFDPTKIVVYSIKVAGRTTVMVFLKNDDPKDSSVFELTKDGKAIWRNGSSGQQRTLGQLEEKRWLKGNLGEDRFTAIRELLNQQFAEQISQAA